jgi:secondary thiamine-phosphate synthase enzyme
MISHSLEKQIVRTSSRDEMIEVTDQVSKLVTEHGVIDGMVIICVPHTTAAITINESADPDVKHDILLKLSKMIPKDDSEYTHAEGNSDSHIKTSLVGNSVTVLVERGMLVLGQWQGIQFCEFDGPRQRQMYVKIVDFGEESS